MAFDDDWEKLIYNRLVADAGNLSTILTGGIYRAALIGRDGINRDKTATAAAFDVAPLRKIKPCAFIVAGEIIYDDRIKDEILQLKSYRQRVRIHFYEDVTYANVDAAEARTRALLFGHQFDGASPLDLVLDRPRDRDMGALMGASMRIVDYLVLAVKGS